MNPFSVPGRKGKYQKHAVRGVGKKGVVAGTSAGILRSLGNTKVRSLPARRPQWRQRAVLVILMFLKSHPPLSEIHSIQPLVVWF